MEIESNIGSELNNLLKDNQDQIDSSSPLHLICKKEQKQDVQVRDLNYKPQKDEYSIKNKYLRKKCGKDKIRLRQQRMKVESLDESIFDPTEAIQIQSGLYITKEGLVRFCYCLSQISFGYQQYPVVSIKKLKSEGIIDLQLEVSWQYPQKPISQAINLIKHLPNQKLQQIADILLKFQDQMKIIKFAIQNLQLTQQDIYQRNIDYQLFLEDCYDYLKNYNLEQPNQLFQYAIGRMNYEKKDIEITKSGYSNSYIELLGLEEESFMTLFLRRYKIDLIQSKDEILNMSLQGLISQTKFQKEDTYEINIITFDGFPIKLYFRLQSIILPKNKKQNDNNYDYIFCFTEIDIDIQYLKALLEYRQRLTQDPSKLSLEDYIRKEASYKFEDIEYSIHSQSFMEKYYTQNVQLLLKLKEQMESKQNIVQTKSCYYRYITPK